jgi:hypothetical protein
MFASTNSAGFSSCAPVAAIGDRGEPDLPTFVRLARALELEQVGVGGGEIVQRVGELRVRIQVVERQVRHHDGG